RKTTSVAGRVVVWSGEFAAISISVVPLVLPATYLGAIPLAGIAYQTRAFADASGSISGPRISFKRQLCLHSAPFGTRSFSGRDDGKSNPLRRRASDRSQVGHYRRGGHRAAFRPGAFAGLFAATIAGQTQRSKGIRR